MTSPAKLILRTALLIALGFGAAQGWLYYKNLPKPNTLTITGTWPTPTKIEKDSKPEPLLLFFSGSAAPLSLVGKEVKDFFHFTPKLQGNLKWRSDSQLEFTPSSDWEVGQKYELTFEKQFFPSHILLEKYEYEFDSPHFAASFAEAKFYEDPQDSKLKKVVATVSFTHAVDKGDLERRLTLKMREEPHKHFDSDAKAIGFKIQYDESNAKAYIHSDILTIPDHDAEVLISIDKGLHAARGGTGSEAAAQSKVAIPGLPSYFKISAISGSQVTNDAHEIDRVITVESSAAMSQVELAKSISVFILPKDKPAIGNQKSISNHHWESSKEIVPEVLATASEIKPEWIPNEREFSPLQSFKFSADVGRYIFVKINKGLKSFGDYPLSKDSSEVLYVEEFPRSVKILHDGALLSLSGDKKLSILTRNLKAVQIEFSRLLPGSINHLITQSGAWSDFKNPEFINEDFGFDNIAEVFTETKSIPSTGPGKSSYSYVDFSSLLSKGAPPRGLFLLRVHGWDEERKSLLSEAADERLILISDLGVVAKDSSFGSHDLFVSSIRSGEPISDAQIEVLGKNGLAVVNAQTDGRGHVLFPDLKEFKREKAPVAYVIRKDGDLSFLPFNRSDRRLNFSRFDTGGLYSSENYEGLSAYLFSDRGIYRPGETAHIGILLKRINWEGIPDGLPLELTVSDPRGAEIKSRKIQFNAAGFEEFTFPTLESALTGTYQLSLYVIKEKSRKALIGSNSIRVEEFFPDRLTIKASLSEPTRAGWYLPQNLKAKINLKNLFGTAAAARKIKGSLKLSSSLPSFAEFKDYRFFDPNSLKQSKSYDEDLGELLTDKDGNAEFDLKLDRFEKTTYRMRFIAEGFEAEGGRSVLADASALISPAESLIAYKPDGDLQYIHKDSLRKVDFIAVTPDLTKTIAPDLEAELIKIVYVSVLTKQADGTYAYQSVKREISRNKKPLNIGINGSDFALETNEPGIFLLVLRNKDGSELSRVDYKVVGEVNLERSLERDAELEIKLSKHEYNPGEEIEVEIQAPYSGTGLITIEKDKVYGFEWFKAESASSIQHIRLPESVEGNGYITVTFLRAMDSPEIYMSPLSYGATPFSVSRARHTQVMKVSSPSQVKPGETIHVNYQSAPNSRIVIFGADEGILQFAKYRTPDPLSHFSRKRALEVTTSQILDLLLPDFELSNKISAPGGDEDALTGRKKNPFKRKGEKPVVFWSGILSEPNGTYDFTIPEYFNGTIRLMALSVSEGAVGVTEASVISQGDFVVQPQAPYYVAPGDEFDATATIANNLKGSGQGALVEVSLKSDNFENLKDQLLTIPIPEGEDRVARFKLRAKDKLGAADLIFSVKVGENQTSQKTSVGIRPASPFMTKVTGGFIKKGLLSGAKAEIPLERTLFEAAREVRASISTVPLGLASGMIQFLKRYPYGCTEQLISQAIPTLILGSRAEFALDNNLVRGSFDKTVGTLQARQNSDGAFGLWSADSYTSDFVSAYATLYLLEAQERGFQTPSELVRRALAYARSLMAEVEEQSDFRSQAFALYLLTRQGELTTNYLTSVRETLDRDWKDGWKQDLTGALIASVYKMLKMDHEADGLIVESGFSNKIPADYDSYYDATIHNSLYLYLLSRHFPDRARNLSGEDLSTLVEGVLQDGFNTLEASSSILGFDAYSKVVESPLQTNFRIEELDSAGASHALTLPQNVMPAASISTNAKKVVFSGENTTNIFYQLSEAGYENAPVSSEIKKNVEVYREYRNDKGDVISETTLDSKVYVHIILRSIGGEAYSDIAITDLVPGGFEIDLNCKDAQCMKSDGQAGEASEAWEPEYVDVQDDRVYLFGSVGPDVKRYVYRLKPTNTGSYSTAPIFAEGMYDRTTMARGLSGKITVKD